MYLEGRKKMLFTLLKKKKSPVILNNFLFISYKNLSHKNFAVLCICLWSDYKVLYDYIKKARSFSVGA